MLQCAYDIFKHEGVLAFYRGLTTPLITSAPVNAIAFAVYEYYRRINNISKNDDCTVFHGVIAGSLAGLA